MNGLRAGTDGGHAPTQRGRRRRRRRTGRSAPGDGLHGTWTISRVGLPPLVNHDPRWGGNPRAATLRTIRRDFGVDGGGSRAPGVSSDLARACGGCPRESSVRRRAILHGARRYGAVSRRATRHRHRNGFFVTEVSVAWSVTQGNLQTAAAISNFSDRIDRLFRSNGFRSTRVSSAFFIGDSRVFGIGASRGARLEAEASESATPARSRR